MSLLTSLLVRDHVVPVRRVEEAIQRQVVQGGDLETALLELDAVPENVLSAYRATLFGLPAITRKQLAGLPQEVTRLVPAEVARQHRIVPIGLRDGQLLVAVSSPLPPNVVRELRFLLGLELSFHISVEVRLDGALAEYYEGPLSPRTSRLLAKLAQRDPGPSPVVGAQSGEPELEGARRDSLPSTAFDERPTRKQTFQVADERLRSSGMHALGVEEARTLITEADSRDNVIEVFFAFARQLFDYTALFVVHDEMADGRSASGSGARPDKVRRIAVPLDVPGAFGAVARSGQLTEVDLSQGELDRIVANDLGRLDGQPAILLPVAIRQRVVILLYGDRSGHPIPRSELEPLCGLVSPLVSAIERIIVARKNASIRPAPSPEKPTSEGHPEAPRRRRPIRHTWFGLPTADPRPVSRPAPAVQKEPDRTADIHPTLDPSTPVQEQSQADFSRVQLRSKSATLLGVPRPAPPPPDVEAQQRSAEPAAPGGSRGGFRSRTATEPSTPHALSRATEPNPGSSSEVAQPSVIVDMGEHVEELVSALMACPPGREGPTVQALVEVGEAALPGLVQRFPGPTWFDRHAPHQYLPRGQDVSAIARALTAFGPSAAPYIASLLDDQDADIRFYATLLASETVHPELLPPLGRRLFDTESEIRALGLDVIRLFSRFAQPYGEVVRIVRAAARFASKDPARRLIAVRALGELRDVESVDIFISLLGEPDEALRTAAKRSLVVLTRQDFGDSPKRWRTWAERHSHRHRIEWLMDALLHPDEDIRRASGDELKQLTQQYHGYHPSLPKRDREIAHRRYVQWWEQQGRVVFCQAADAE